VIFVKLHEPPRELDGLRLAAYFQYGVPADQFFGLGERAIDCLDRAVGERHDCARRAWQQAALINQRAVSGALGRKLTHCLEQLRRRRPGWQRLVELHHRHETHDALLTRFCALSLSKGASTFVTDLADRSSPSRRLALRDLDMIRQDFSPAFLGLGVENTFAHSTQRQRGPMERGY
jgi:hypothetical protein